MTILITDTLTTENAKYATFTCGKVQAFVTRRCYDGDVSWRVCVMNSSHATWRRAGRYFETLADAVAAYKNPSVKAILAAAADALA